jgi:hypothetical protein
MYDYAVQKIFATNAYKVRVVKIYRILGFGAW